MCVNKNIIFSKKQSFVIYITSCLMFNMFKGKNKCLLFNMLIC